MKRLFKFITLMMVCILLLNSMTYLSGCGRTETKKETGYKVTQYNDLSGNQASFYTIVTPNNELIIIDGGWAANEPQVRQIIKEHNNVVDAWIISHPHQDHAGAFNKICADPQGITIKTIYDSPIDYNKVKQVGEQWDDITIFDTYQELTKDKDNVISLNRGDSFQLFGLNVLVLNAYDKNVTDISKDITNDGALIFKISSQNESMIFCSDVKSMEKVVTEQFKDELKCDYIQAAHHGNWAFSNEFYDLTEAKAVFFDAPAWIMTDAKYPAYELAEYLKNKGITIYDFTSSPNSVVLN